MKVFRLLLDVNASTIASLNSTFVASNPGEVSYILDQHGRAGQGIHLGNAYLSSLQALTLPSGNAPRVVSGWVRLTASTRRNPNANGWAPLFSYGAASHNNIFGLLEYPDHNLYFWGNGNDFTFSSSALDRDWYHFVLAYDGTTVTLWKNGRKVGSNPHALKTISPSIFFIGVAIGSTEQLIDWTFSSLRVYDGAFSESDVSSLFYTGCRPGFFSTSSAGTSCAPCAAGSFSEYFGQDACVLCPTGFTSLAGQSYCTPVSTPSLFFFIR